MDDTPRMLPRNVQRTTPLTDTIILYPGSDPSYAQMAERLAQAVEEYTGSRPEALTDSALMPSRSSPLPEVYRRKTLLLLGNLNTNRAVLSLYANYYCATDATYPGGDGYDLRTLVNPYGMGRNMILAGGSTLNGVRRAVERLIEHIQQAEAGELRFLLEVDLDPAVRRMLAEWPETPLNMPALTVETDKKTATSFTQSLTRAIGAYSLHYAWTGDERYGFYARDCLRTLNAHLTDSYGDWHYQAERVLRALPWLCAGGFLDGDERLRTDELLLATAMGTQDMWWRKRDGLPPLGHRHHAKGTFEFLLLSRYLRDQASK